MSRVAKMPVTIPAGVDVSINDAQISVKGTGGTLSLAALRQSGNMALSASLVKMIGLPLVATVGAWLYGFRGPELGILFLYFGAPTAAASFVMARAAQGNHELAAAIIVITTLMAAVTTNIGIFVLQAGGWI